MEVVLDKEEREEIEKGGWKVVELGRFGRFDQCKRSLLYRKWYCYDIESLERMNFYIRISFFARSSLITDLEKFRFLAYTEGTVCRVYYEKLSRYRVLFKIQREKIE